MKHALAAMAVAAIVFAVPVHAETVDLATVKCSDLAKMSDDEGNFLFAWLLGYAGGQASDTTLDLSTTDAVGKSIGEYCAANPEVGLVSAVMNVLSE
jgi:acid stress chaperone HdeB